MLELLKLRNAQNYILIEWFGLEETFKDHLVQPPPAMGRDVFHFMQKSLYKHLEPHLWKCLSDLGIEL